MKIFRFLVRGAILFLTAIWGIMFGLVNTISALASGNLPQNTKFGFAAWLVMSIVGLILPCFLVMFEERTASKIALFCSIAGNALTAMITACFSAQPGGADFFCFVPQLLMTPLVWAYVFLLKKTKWREEIIAEKEKPSRSIFE